MCTTTSWQHTYMLDMLAHHKSMYKFNDLACNAVMRLIDRRLYCRKTQTCTHIRHNNLFIIGVPPTTVATIIRICRTAMTLNCCIIQWTIDNNAIEIETSNGCNGRCRDRDSSCKQHVSMCCACVHRYVCMYVHCAIVYCVLSVSWRMFSNFLYINQRNFVLFFF